MVAKGKRHSKRHLLVDRQGLVLEVQLHGAKVVDLKTASSSCWSPPHPIASRASQLWLDTGYTGEDKGAEIGCKAGALGWTAEIVRHPPKLVPEEVIEKWVMELTKGGSADRWGEAQRRAEGF